MTIFEQVKSALDLRDVAEAYGLSVGKNGLVNCLFHEDRTPSMKLYADHFYCFGCGEHGDVIALISKLFDITPIEAAQKLSSDFGISLSEEKSSITAKIKHFNRAEEENRAFRILSDYCKFLCDCQKRYAPKSPNEPLHPLFTESITKLPEYEYYRDIFIAGSSDERKDFLSNRKELLNELERKLINSRTRNNRETSRLGKIRA